MITDSLTKHSQGLITIQLLSMKLFCLSRPKLGILSLFSIVPVFHCTSFPFNSLFDEKLCKPPCGRFWAKLNLMTQGIQGNPPPELVWPHWLSTHFFEKFNKPCTWKWQTHLAGRDNPPPALFINMTTWIDLYMASTCTAKVSEFSRWSSITIIETIARLRESTN